MFKRSRSVVTVKAAPIVCLLSVKVMRLYIFTYCKYIQEMKVEEEMREEIERN
jgi:hypothetical protein